MLSGALLGGVLGILETRGTGTDLSAGVRHDRVPDEGGWGGGDGERGRG